MMAERFCVAIAGCTRLQTLKLIGRLIDSQIGPALWTACLGIRTLHLEHTALPKWTPSFVGTSRIQRLIVQEAQKSHNGLLLLQNCPQLRYIYWRDSEAVKFPLRSIGEALLTTQHWPHLEELDLNLLDSKDTDLAPVLSGISRLVTLHAEKSGFGLKCLEGIAKHHTTIKTLNLAMCSLVNSSMIQTILSSMTALEYLNTGRIHYLDIVNGSPWVSLRLQRLVIGINMETATRTTSQKNHGDTGALFASQQRMVFRRLSTLDRLVVLDLISPGSIGSTGYGRTLDLRLDEGLDTLSTLKQLESFSFKSYHQQMKMSDIQWMITSWPRLRKLAGRFSSDPDRFYEFKHTLNNHGIRVFD